MKRPLVSIITIVYNGEKHLEQTIQSVLSQTYAPIEYIIIDGGSVDNSVAIIKKYSDRISYWISEKDRGVSDAFNKGIAVSNGDIIGLINADDWYEPNAVENMVNEIGDADVAYGDLRYWKDGKKDMTVMGNHEYMGNEMSMNHPTVFIKKHCYENVLFNTSLKYAMDYELLLKLKIAGYLFIHIPKVLANMRWDGISDQQWYKACREVLEVKNKYLPKQRLKNELYFHKQVASIKVGRLLQRMHMYRAVRFYRKWLSPIRKRYD